MIIQKVEDLCQEAKKQDHVTCGLFCKNTPKMGSAEENTWSISGPGISSQPAFLFLALPPVTEDGACFGSTKNQTTGDRAKAHTPFGRESIRTGPP